MTTRPTPFGLFSGCSTGRVGDATHLRLAARSDYRRHTRLDMEYLRSLAILLEKDGRLDDVLTLCPNATLRQVGGRLRYVEQRAVGLERSHHISEVELSDYLCAALDRARTSATMSALAQAVADVGDVDIAEARDFVRSLVTNQVLVSSLPPSITGEEPLSALVRELQASEAASPEGACLLRAHDALQEIDRSGLGIERARYEAVAEGIGTLPAKVDPSRLFHVDLFKPCEAATLSAGLVQEMLEGVGTLHRITGGPLPDRLDAFRRAFEAKYGDAEVPLLEVLDEEMGIGFGSAKPEAMRAEGRPNRANWDGRDGHCLRLLTEARASGRQELRLTQEDIAKLAGPTVAPLPDAFSIVATIWQREGSTGKDPWVHLKGGGGPSGARMLGRFCYLHTEIEALVREHLKAEQDLRPDALFAEIVHHPDGRVGNILRRPVLRSLEIPVLGRSGAPDSQQILLTDLVVGIVHNRVVLRCRRRGLEVLPRLTTAHSYWRRGSLGIYSFLAALQTQGVREGFAWQWGGLEALDFLPRVTFGRLVFQRARWRLRTDCSQQIARERTPRQRFEAVQDIRRRIGLPRLVLLTDGDQELMVDLENPLSVESFSQLVKARAGMLLQEFLPGPGELACAGPEGSFTHELVLLASRQGAPRDPQSAEVRPPTQDVQRHVYTPGSEWLYLKLYCSPAFADRLLIDLLPSSLHEITRSGRADRWFFVRYRDPEWHLRLRFQGQPQVLLAEVLPRLHSALDSHCGSGPLWSWQVDTYEREVSRYGGPRGIALAEDVFFADSEAVLAALPHCAPADRWRLAALGAEFFMKDLGFGTGERLNIVTSMRDAYQRSEPQVSRRRLGDTFRSERRFAEGFAHADWASIGLGPCATALERRGIAWRGTVSRLVAADRDGHLTVPLVDVVRHCIHMNINRVLREHSRAVELQVYDFLTRLYQSQVSRRRKEDTRESLAL